MFFLGKIRKKADDTEEILEYAINNIKNGYMKDEEPEYGPPLKQRNYCKVQDLESFRIDAEQ
jgi:hypothetical protein